jgi:hypothetical protein
MLFGRLGTLRMMGLAVDLSGGRVRDGSVKPAARCGLAGGEGEDLQRTARAAGNAIILTGIKQILLIYEFFI